MKKLTFTELEMVTGGDAAAADAYLHELHESTEEKVSLPFWQELQMKKLIII